MNEEKVQELQEIKQAIKNNKQLLELHRVEVCI